MHCCTAGFRTGLRPLGVKTGKAQNERMFSGVPPKADLRELMSTRPSSQVTCSRLLHHDNTKPPQPVTFAVTPQGNTHPQRFRCDGGRGGHLDASGGSLVSSAGLLLCKRPDIGNFTALVTVQSSFVFRSLITVVLCGPSVSKNRDAGVAIVWCLMAGSTCSNHRPDTLMQDHIRQPRNPLATHGRTIHWVNLRRFWHQRAESGYEAISEVGSELRVPSPSPPSSSHDS
jgi:hypothetical protein